MIKGKMIINSPNLLLEKDQVVYMTQVYDNGKEKEIYFKFPCEYREYLDEINSDAFLCALLYYAMHKNLDIEINGSITEQFYYQITNYFIPII